MVRLPQRKHLGRFLEWHMVQPVVTSEGDNITELDCRFMLYEISRYSDGSGYKWPQLPAPVSASERQKFIRDNPGTSGRAGIGGEK